MAGYPRQFEGRVAVVVGASSGINFGIAQHLCALGTRLAIVSRSDERISAAAGQLRHLGGAVQGYAGDVRHPEAMQRIMAQVAEEWGAIDMLVSGAAGNFFVDAKDLSPNGFKTVVDIDLIGSFNVLSAAFPYLRKPGSSIVNISAPQAQRPMRQQAHACVAKAGVDMLTRCLALEWGEMGIRVNAVSPGPVADTEGFARLAADPAAQEQVMSALALPRLGTKQDIARAVAWLLSEEADFVTGTIVDCDGGMKLGNFHTPGDRATRN
jgi:NAD(P)-dependent dehydrogenase (short-subunit alcohol dehydrogenase family)